LLLHAADNTSAGENWPRMARIARRRAFRGDRIFPSAGMRNRSSGNGAQGIGQSSPTVWEDRIFLTSALEDGRQRIVFCIDARNGKPLWEHTPWTGSPENRHVMNGWASASAPPMAKSSSLRSGAAGCTGTPSTASGSGPRDLGQFECPWGTAACPVIVAISSFRTAIPTRRRLCHGLDKRTGKTIWTIPVSIPRLEHADPDRGE